MPKFTPDTINLKSNTVTKSLINLTEKNKDIKAVPGVKDIFIKYDPITNTGDFANRSTGRGALAPSTVKNEYQRAMKNSLSQFTSKVKGDIITDQMLIGMNEALSTVGLPLLEFNPQEKTIDKASIMEQIQNLPITPVDTKKIDSQEFKQNLKQKGGSRFQKEPSKKDPIVTTPTTKTEEITEILRQISITTAGSKTRNLLIDKLRTFGFNSPEEAMAFLKQQ